MANKPTLEEIQDKLDKMETSAGMVPVCDYSWAVRIANHFRNKGYSVEVKPMSYFYFVTITEPVIDTSASTS